MRPDFAASSARAPTLTPCAICTSCRSSRRRECASRRPPADHRRVGANLDVVSTTRSASWGILKWSVGLLDEAEAVAAEHRAVLHDHAIADDHALPDRHARMETQSSPTRAPAADDHVRWMMVRADRGAGFR